MNVEQMLSVVQSQPSRVLGKEQESVVRHGDGPMWVIAGPGSGKTEVLVLRCLKLTCVD